MLGIVTGVIFVLSFIFAMLGLGGSMLYFPVFHWFGYNFKSEAIPAGLLGVGGGFLLVLMMLMIGYPTKKAAATSAFVVIFSSFSGF